MKHITYDYPGVMEMLLKLFMRIHNNSNENKESLT